MISKAFLREGSRHFRNIAIMKQQFYILNIQDILSMYLKITGKGLIMAILL